MYMNEWMNKRTCAPKLKGSHLVMHCEQRSCWISRCLWFLYDTLLAVSLSLSILTAIFQVNLGKPVFIEAKDDGGGGDNWTTGAISRTNLQTNHHHQQTNIQLLQGGCPSCCPTSSVKALKVYKCSVAKYNCICGSVPKVDVFLLD